MSRGRNFLGFLGNFSSRTPLRLFCSSSLTQLQSWEAKLIDLFHSHAPIADLTGMRLRFDGEETVVELPYNNKLDSSPRPGRLLGSTHGGVYCLLADTAGWFASARGREGGWPLTTTLSCHFVKSSKEKDIAARARVVQSSPRQDICEVRIVDKEGLDLAYVTAVFAVAARKG
ncbi:hypothetical protein GUITHDRAFT_156328 [Guillardia theta CCMP2712]|uniref:Thioesterase domain-containing protein n=2 Tax=Guillardia theta TaxID=55529 RepID=L1I988_GUITC|nr:hypothetical protein GUITHDRAFT_156328 [Guillardia theta CCMP2712]EKX32474.1 hypothetical protein GUITHDRAFT_156328 [Guillardia theta CCMP2712]|eukprot:XP_005819454.1 hypothetical protein GUITHDRAFT_156328 [Guillardia theta CCMP2712]